MRVCRCRRKQHLVIDLADEGKLTAAVHVARDWIAAHLPGGVLNVPDRGAASTPASTTGPGCFYRRCSAAVTGVCPSATRQSSFRPRPGSKS
jgi:hypothetical protein